MLAWYMLSSCVCPSVCLSVTSRHCTKMAKLRIMQTTPYDSPGTLVFWCQRFGQKCPPMGGSKGEFLHLALPFISLLQVIVDISNLVCRLNIADLTDQIDQQIVAEMGVVTSCDPLIIFSPLTISLEWLKLEISDLVCMLIIASPSLRTTNCP